MFDVITCFYLKYFLFLVVFSSLVTWPAVLSITDTLHKLKTGARLSKPVLRIRIRSDPVFLGNPDPDPDPYSKNIPVFLFFLLYKIV